jgi:hypothetical protein
VVSQAAAGPPTPGDYEASDQTLVFAAAAQLSRQSGLYPSKLLGNAGFAKIDLNLSPVRVRGYTSLERSIMAKAGSGNFRRDGKVLESLPLGAGVR